MSDEPRLEFHYQCSCGQQLRGWAYTDEVIQRELACWRAEHEGHDLMTPTEYRKSRRRRRAAP